MGSGESTKRLTVEKSEDDQSTGMVTVTERVVRRLRGEQELPLKETDEISQDDINNLWRELHEEKAMIDHQKEHMEEFMQKAFDEGRKVEIKRIKEGRSQVGDGGVQEIDNHWRKVLEQKDNEACVRENKLLEEINILKKKITDNESLTIEQFNQAVQDATHKFTARTRPPACQHLQNEVINCYKKYPTQALRCSQQVQSFINCVKQ